MRRTWYDINPTNNTLYWYNPTYYNISSASITGGVVTFNGTFTTPFPVGSIVHVSGFSSTPYNFNWTVVSSSATSFTASTFQPDSTASGTLGTAILNDSLTKYVPNFGTFYPLIIQPGTYNNFSDLSNAFTAAMTTCASLTGGQLVLSGSVSYNAISRDFTFTLGSGTNPFGFFVSFYDDSEPTPPGISQLGFTNDSQEIVGGFQSNLLSALRSVFVTSTSSTPSGPGTYTSPFPAQLSSLEALYLRCSLGTSNFASSGFEPQVPNSSTGLNVSQLWARIELGESVYDPLTPFITYVEPSDGNYPLYLQQKQLDQMILILTDDKGRDLSLLQTYPQQAQTGALSYKLVASWEVLTEIPAISRAISLSTIQANPPFCRP